MLVALALDEQLVGEVVGVVGDEDLNAAHHFEHVEAQVERLTEQVRP